MTLPIIPSHATVLYLQLYNVKYLQYLVSTSKPKAGQGRGDDMPAMEIVTSHHIVIYIYLILQIDIIIKVNTLHYVSIISWECDLSLKTYPQVLYLFGNLS